jgi:hypothetical protein
MRTLFIIAAALLAVALPATALASRSPSHSERAKLRKAVSSSKLVTKQLRRGHFRLGKPRISTSGPWARGNILTENYDDPFNPVVALFKRKHGKWRLKAIGTRGIGCSKPRAPRAVRLDLKLRCR